eukprot:s203_g5.t1
MGNLSLRSPTSMPAPAPIFYNKDWEFLETYGSEAPPQKPAEVPEVPAPDCIGEFEITNFAITCATTKTVSEGKQDCREIVSGPILAANRFRFGLAVAWSVKQDGSVEESKNLGACSISLEITILNKKKGQELTLCDPTYHGISRMGARGWSRSFDLGDSRRHDGVKGLPLSDVLEPQAGWLHNGSLRVMGKVSVVIGFDAGTAPVAEANGQQEVCESLQALLQTGNLSDVVLKVGSETIDAHRLILAARSPVFERMFSCPMKETTDNEDFDAISMRALVKYLYTGVVDHVGLESDDYAVNLLQAAHRYEVPGLVDRCVQVLVGRLRVETAAERLEMAELLGNRYFKAQCLEFISLRLGDIQATEAWERLFEFVASAYSRLVSRRPALLKDLVEVIVPPTKKTAAEDPPEVLRAEVLRAVQHDLERERLRVLAEIRNDELSGAEAVDLF